MCRLKINLLLASAGLLTISQPGALALMPDDVASVAGTNTAVVRVRENGSFNVRRVGDNFSVEADHADVPGLLQTLFKRADGQYTSDGTAVGQITLRLINQPFTTVVHAICDQCYLRYTLANGIYRFQRDDEAVKAAFVRLNILDAAFQDQLRRLGVNVSTELEHGAVGGFGGGGRRAPIIRYQLENTPASANGTGASFSAQLPNNLNSAASSGVSKDAGNTGRDIANATAPRGDNSAPSAYGRLNMTNVNPQVLQQLMTNQYGYVQPQFRSFLNQNRLVTLQVPPNQPIPVADAFAALGQQANTPILIDPAVPSGLKFRMWGTIPPRPLPEAMNALASYARLQWRMVGNSIFVSSPPDIQLYYGDVLLARPSYPSVPAGYPANKAYGVPDAAGPAGPPGAVPGSAPSKPEKSGGK